MPLKLTGLIDLGSPFDGGGGCSSTGSPEAVSPCPWRRASRSRRGRTSERVWDRALRAPDGVDPVC